MWEDDQRGVLFFRPLKVGLLLSGFRAADTDTPPARCGNAKSFVASIAARVTKKPPSLREAILVSRRIAIAIM